MAAPVLAGERGDGIRQQSPMNRVGEPEEVAAAVHFLASEAGQWSSGAVLDCNGVVSALNTSSNFSGKTHESEGRPIGLP